jgi:predicted acylesterase/phospholipase RssA
MMGKMFNFAARLTGRCLAAVLFIYLTGCGKMTRDAVWPEAARGPLHDQNIDLAGYQTLDPKFLDQLQESIRQELLRIDPPQPNEVKKPLNVLALSGGGMYGAFDVGVLQGWSQSGKRPEFDVITGISTGALIAPFAFVGPKYDDFLREMYLSITPEQIYKKRRLTSILFSESVASSEPLKKLIDRAVTPELLQEVAAAHQQGRRLYVGTTNLDSRKLVIWDMGAIASSGKPDALERFRTILLASSSVPGFFPPVYIEIEVEGGKFHEMHVDGGASSSVFVHPFMLRIRKENPAARVGSNLYVISSGKVFADPEIVERNVLKIAGHAISSLLYAETRSDLFVIYNLALQTGMNYHSVAVPPNFAVNPNSLSLTRDETRRLYEVGYQMGATQQGWRNKPPGADGKDQYQLRTQFELSATQPVHVAPAE